MTHKERKEEVREILALETDELVKRANGQLILFPTLDEVYDYLAEEMVNEFEKAAKGDKIFSAIRRYGCVGPTGIMKLTILSPFAAFSNSFTISSAR